MYLFFWPDRAGFKVAVQLPPRDGTGAHVGGRDPSPVFVLYNVGLRLKQIFLSPTAPYDPRESQVMLGRTIS
jgi:hypothetical protein